MRKFVLALALFLTTTVSSNRRAPTAQRHGGRAEACNRDVQRHCRSVINQGDFTILACLQQNRAQISAACNQVLKNHGQ